MKTLGTIWLFVVGFAIMFVFGLDVVAQIIPTTTPSVGPALQVVTQTSLLSWLQANAAMILAVLLGLSETLALIPSVRANSIFEMLHNIIMSLAPKK